MQPSGNPAHRRFHDQQHMRPLPSSFEMRKRLSPQDRIETRGAESQVIAPGHRTKRPGLIPLAKTAFQPRSLLLRFDPVILPPEPQRARPAVALHQQPQLNTLAAKPAHIVIFGGQFKRARNRRRRWRWRRGRRLSA